MPATPDTDAGGSGMGDYPLENLLPASWKQTVSSWLAEDCPDFDAGGFVVGSGAGTATLYMKTDGATVAGLPFFREVFNQVLLSAFQLSAFGWSPSNVQLSAITTVRHYCLPLTGRL